MTEVSLLWECVCGHQEYDEKTPEECPRCHNLDTFMQLPNELAEERSVILEGDLLSEVPKKTKNMNKGRKKK